jgi:hypothetical protein
LFHPEYRNSFGAYCGSEIKKPLPYKKKGIFLIYNKSPREIPGFFLFILNEMNCNLIYNYKKRIATITELEWNNNELEEFYKMRQLQSLNDFAAVSFK